MQEKEINYLENLDENKKRKKKKRIWIMLCSILVAIGVLGMFILPGEATESDGTSTVNESLVIGFTPSQHSASSGTPISVNVISNYSKANHESDKVKSVIKIGKLPEGISLAGFDGKGQQIVKLQGAEGVAEQKIILQIVKGEDGISYIEYEQPEGSTLEFYIQFKSENGITANGTSVKVEVATDKIQNLGEASVSIKEGLSESSTLTWTATNKWDPVDKKVNDADSNTIAVTADNKLSGCLTYTIKAISLNRENFGRVWTKEVQVKDTLTLPTNIKLPSDAKVDGNAIVTGSGETILSFENLPEGTVVDKLELQENNTKIYYSLTVPNTHVTNGVLTGEQDNLDLTMRLNAGLLVLPDDYNTSNRIGTIDTDKIINNVSVKPIPYHGDAKEPTTDSVITVPEIEAENWKLTKTADKDNVEAGGVVTYTIKLENTSQTPIEVKDGNSYYTVTDKLPAQLYLTPEQQNALPGNVIYDAGTNTITWIPSTEAIAYGQPCEISFGTTVKEITDENIKDLYTGYQISNTAKFKDGTSNPVVVNYRKAVLTISKTSTTEDNNKVVYNGEKITYTVTVSNNSGVDYQRPETITDTLPDGLTLNEVFVYVSKDWELRPQELAINGGECVLHDVPENVAGYANCGKTNHKLIYTRDEQNLSFGIDYLSKGESVKIQYVCTVDTDKITTRQNIYNTAKITDGESKNTVGVDYPIKLDKSVAQDTSVAYQSGQVFDYTITVSNDAAHPSWKNDLELVDQLPAGMLPCPNGTDSVLKMKTSSGEQEISWSDYIDGTYDSAGGSFYTSVSGREATVTKENGAVKLTWAIGQMGAGQEIKLTYKAQMTLTQAQQDAGISYKFTNTATIDQISKTVTVTGGQKVGSIIIKKAFVSQPFEDEPDQIYASILNNDHSMDSRWNTEFVLTRLDENGNEIAFDDGTMERVATIDQCTLYGPEYCYTFSKLPIGKYKVTERNGEWEQTDTIFDTTFWDYSSARPVEYKNQRIVNVTEDAAIEVPIWNIYYNPDYVNLQKSVYAIVKEDANGNWRTIPEKYLFSVDEQGTEKTYVIYNITVGAFGGRYVEINSLIDKLPQGMTFKGIYNASNFNSSSFGNSITNSGSCDLNNATQIETYSHYVSQVDITADYDTVSNEVDFTLSVGGDSNFALSSCEIISFLMLCEVDSNVVAGQELTNTIELMVPDDIRLNESEVYKTTNTPYDANQNNGDAVLEKTENGTKTITSSVTVVPENTIVPGIEKNAVSYIPSGFKEAEIANLESAGQNYHLGEFTNIQSNAAVKWEITVHNDGTQDMTNYSIADVISEDLGMMTSEANGKSEIHLLTRAEKVSYQIASTYKYQIYNYKDELQRDVDLSEIVWAQVEDGTKVNNFTFDFSGSEYMIPSGGYAVLTLYTNNTVQENKIYTNTATIIPTQEFVADKIALGELVKDSDGKNTGVKASDQVYSLGKYASVSWKTITEKNNSANTAKGASSKNYIVVEKESESVTYTNNIRNISDNNFNKFVVIDLLPMKNDTGVVNRNDKRGSEFQVIYAENMSVKVLNNESEVTREIDNFQLEFSHNTAFTQNDFAGVESQSWHTKYDKDKDHSFRIVLPDTFMLAPQETLIIQYDGKIESSAIPGAIAWNSFGYQYYLSTTQTQYMRAEPPKVGVMIPTAPIIQKEVIDSDGNVQEKNADINFTFALFEKSTSDTGTISENYLCEFTLSQGGYRQLDDLKDTNGEQIELKDGTEYVIREMTDEQYMPEYYEAIGIGKYGGELSDSFSFVYQKTEKLNILARNKVTNYISELPATGGASALAAKVIGILLLTLSAVLLCGYKLRIKKERGRG